MNKDASLLARVTEVGDTDSYFKIRVAATKTTRYTVRNNSLTCRLLGENQYYYSRSNALSLNSEVTRDFT